MFPSDLALNAVAAGTGSIQSSPLPVSMVAVTSSRVCHTTVTSLSMSRPFLSNR